MERIQAIGFVGLDALIEISTVGLFHLGQELYPYNYESIRNCGNRNWYRFWVKATNRKTELISSGT
jgi:hypothetical protein